MRRPWALPLVPLYAAGLRVVNGLRGQPRTLARPVVSVGSLSAGGAGKTPVVLMLARLLASHGVRADVLSRGYGRRDKGVERVDPAGGAEQFGDEPLELARAGVQVWAGADRYQAGLEAEAAGQADVHLLDDGFQHRRLTRALDVVLLTLEDTSDRLLPAGNLREPLRQLRRAGVVVVREHEREALEPWTRGLPVWTIRRTIRLPEDTPSRPLAFCGIARPHGFFTGLREAGCDPAATVAFADHHRYAAASLDRLLAAAARAGADGFLTTAKDAVKLPESWRQRLGRLAVAELRAEPVEADRVWTALRDVCGLAEADAAPHP